MLLSYSPVEQPLLYAYCHTAVRNYCTVRQAGGAVSERRDSVADGSFSVVNSTFKNWATLLLHETEAAAAAVYNRGHLLDAMPRRWGTLLVCGWTEAEQSGDTSTRVRDPGDSKSYRAHHLSLLDTPKPNCVNSGKSEGKSQNGCGWQERRCVRGRPNCENGAGCRYLVFNWGSWCGFCFCKFLIATALP